MVKRAYFALAREFHTDGFAGLRLGSAQQKLDVVFSTIQNAHATLMDPAKRGEYEAKVSLEKGGGSSDIGAIFAAESDFQKVKLLVERGDLAGAGRIIGKVAAILASREDVQGYRIFLDWWASKNAATVDTTCRELAALYKVAPAAHNLPELQGWIFLEVGNLKSARTNFKKALDGDPRLASAERGLRQVNRKLEEEQKAASSGLGRFLKR
jgi:curved DNA-binding protein CbpA